MIVLESRWVKVLCICSLRIYVVAMGEPRWIHSQDSPPPIKKGRESSKFRTTLTAAQPRDRKPTTAAAVAAAAAAAAVQPPRGLGPFSVGVCAITESLNLVANQFL